MTKTVVESLEEILERLDQEMEFVAAAHVSAAIDALRNRSDPEEG